METLGADMLHVDVMDGHFVPNLTLGPPIVKSLRKCTTLPLDCHLMVSEPWNWLDRFIEAGANSLTVHVECGRVRECCERIREGGCKVGVALKPGSEVEGSGIVELVEEGLVDMVLVMSVEPGFGGQKFMEKVMEKVGWLRRRFGELDIEVDGGLNTETVEIAAKAGANVVVAGSAVFGAEDPGKVIEVLRKVVDSAAETE